MSSECKRRFTWIDIDEVKSAFLKEPFPARGHRGDLGDLRLSISRFGIINPIIVRVRQGKLQVICGYRRWLAALVADVQQIPVIVSRLSDEEAEALFREESAFVSSTSSRTGSNQRPEQRDRADHGTRAAAGRGGPLETFDPTPDVQLDPRLETPVRTVSGGTSRREIFAADRVRGEADRVFVELAAIYDKIRRDGIIPSSDIEQLADSIVDLDLVNRGLDVREIGQLRVEGCDAASADRASHSLRVALLTQHLVGSRVWSSSGERRLVLAGLLHDVGMLFIPADWFQGPFVLTRARKDRIKRHTTIGADVLRRSGAALAELADVARDHHERWDGTGYPAGKSGRDIPLAARVIGLLDSYAAMISTRPHRDAYLIGEALGLMRESGEVGIFEPALVKGVLDVFTSCPIGMRGRLADDSRIRVVRTATGRAKSHLIRVENAADYEASMWFREDELVRQLTEVGLGTVQRGGLDSRFPVVRLEAQTSNA